MHTNQILRKGLVVGIILLFVATSISTTPAHNISVHTSVQNHVPTGRTGNWTEVQKLLASDGSSWDSFGMSVSSYGDTALIGAPYDGDNGYNSGSAYVFTRTGTTWTQQQKLLASDGAGGDLFGFSVFLSGDTALIGAFGDDSFKGSAYVFTRTGTTWTQQAKLLASDGAAEDYFGYAASHDNDTVIIGAPQDDDNGQYSGSAYVFTLNGTTWTQQAKLLASDGAPSDNFGCSISLSDDTALIGAMDDTDNGNFSGSAYIFTRTGTTWAQQAKLLASDGAVGDQFGVSVSLSGDTALIGAYEDSDIGTASGSAYVFTRTGTTWTQQQKLLASDGEAYDKFGWSVSLVGDTALIGAAGDDSLKGSTYVFISNGTTWTQQQKLLASDGVADNYFGCSISLSDGTVLIGAFGGDDFNGSAYVFTNESINQPPLFGAPTPANGSTNNPLSFSWSILINDPEGDAFSWTIQCSNEQTNSATGATNGTKTLALSGLAFSTTYKVLVNATDPTGSGMYTRKWYTFTTKANQPPNPPVIHGPASGKAKQPYDYTFNSTDPNGDNVFYYIDWGDNSNSGWIGPYSSGVAITQSHTWANKGTYTIKAKAKDIYGNESGWGTLSVTMPLSYEPPYFRFFEWLFERFPHAFPILRQLLGY